MENTPWQLPMLNQTLYDLNNTREPFKLDTFVSSSADIYLSEQKHVETKLYYS